MRQTDSPIQLLPDHLINQIAAGEVIERPASVVKELLDNALDAGAGQIDIDIEQGGMQLIRVQDDGRGIRETELSLALTRHATSKIKRLSDLHTLLTMGFRGEALPSIAAVSRFTITSRHADQEHAWCLHHAGRDEAEPIAPASHPIGTTVECRDLFYNTPARRKFLRSERTEFYQILQWVRQVAISHPRVGFKLRHNGRVILRANACNDRENAARVRVILGSRFLENAGQINSEFEGLALEGWIGFSAAARTVNDSQFFALNGRIVKDKRLNHAINKAYQGVIPEGRYAAYFLSMTIDPAQVDVNVHPAKTEVRFARMREVHDAVYASLHALLTKAEQREGEGPRQQSTMLVAEPRSIVNPSTAFPKSKMTRESSICRPETHYEATTVVRETGARYATPSSISLSESNWVLGELLLVRRKDENATRNELLLMPFRPAYCWYVDRDLQHQWRMGKVLSAPLLFPVSLQLDQLLSRVMQENESRLQRLGFTLIERDGKLIVGAIPTCLSQACVTNEFWKAFPINSTVDETIEFMAKAHVAVLSDQNVLQAVTQANVLDVLEMEASFVRRITEADLMTLLQQGAQQ